MHLKVYLYNILLFIFCLLCDQMSKLYILLSVDLLPISITSFLRLVLVWNNGVSFSFLSGINPYWLIASNSIILLWISYEWHKSHDMRIKLSWIMVMSGAVGNIIDRIRYGAVIDFLDFYWHIYHYPTFNIADVFIVLGVMSLLVHMYNTQHVY